MKHRNDVHPILHQGILYSVNIVVLSVPDCPNAGRVLDLLREASAGRGDVAIEPRVVDVSQPMPPGFSGSPTVLIDGQNRSGAPAIREPACTAVLPSLADLTDWTRMTAQ